ncbi:uncharacterized protein METZ01_LOCUS46792, partial [marine metagenome]
VRSRDIRTNQRGAHGYPQHQAKDVITDVPSSEHFNFGIPHVPVPLQRVARLVTSYRPITSTPDCEYLQIATVRKKTLDQDEVVARLVIPVDGRWAKRIKEVERLKHPATPPGNRLATHRNAPAIVPVTHRKTV